jgi:hypothetical protein
MENLSNFICVPLKNLAHIPRHQLIHYSYIKKTWDSKSSFTSLAHPSFFACCKAETCSFSWFVIATLLSLVHPSPIVMLSLIFCYLLYCHFTSFLILLKRAGRDVMESDLTPIEIQHFFQTPSNFCLNHIKLGFLKLLFFKSLKAREKITFCLSDNTMETLHTLTWARTTINNWL